MSQPTRRIILWIAALIILFVVAAFSLTRWWDARHPAPKADQLVRQGIKEIKDISSTMLEENRALKLKLDTVANSNKAMTKALDAAQKHIIELDKNYQQEAARNRSEIRATRQVVLERQAVRSRLHELAKTFEPVKMDDE